MMSQNIKVVHISPSYKPAYCYGGPTMSIAKLCEQLKASNVNIIVLTTKANGAEELDVQNGSIHIIEGVDVSYFSRLTKDHTHLSIGLLIALFKLLRVARITDDKLVIHIHSWWNLVAMLSALISHRFKVPVIISPRGMLTDYTRSYKHTIMKNMIHKFFARRLLQKSHIHATSQQEACDIKSQINNHKVTIIPNLVDIPCNTSGAITTSLNTKKLAGLAYVPFRRDLDNDKCLTLLFFSRLDRKKGIDILFEALSKCTFNWQLSIAGTGNLAYIQELKLISENLGLSKKICWLGHVDNQQKYAVMQGHDLMVLPSRNENFGNVVIECLSVGTAVLISDKVGLADYISKTELGWVCEANSKDLLRSLTIARNDLQKRMIIRIKAGSQIKKDFNNAKLAEAYHVLYQRVYAEQQK
jgi:glycosyltransferase involved in cell wall biosynthesis